MKILNGYEENFMRRKGRNLIYMGIVHIRVYIKNRQINAQ